MTWTRTRLGAAALMLAGALALSACSSSNPSTGSSGSDSGITLVKAGTLTVCSNVPFDPMEFKDDAGKVVGFDIDMMQLVADKLGVTLEILESDFAQLTSGTLFASKKCDLGASAISITDARKSAILFSDPYFDAEQSLGTKTDSGITSLGDLKGKKLAVQTDTTGADYANEHAAEYGYEVVVFEDGGAACTAIISGRADAVLVDRAVIAKFVATNDGTTIVDDFPTGEQYGFAAKINDANATALMAVVNEVIAATASDGTYLTLYQKWIDPKATTAAPPTK